jgi:hypothetical protein
MLSRGYYILPAAAAGRNGRVRYEMKKKKVVIIIEVGENEHT